MKPIYPARPTANPLLKRIIEEAQNPYHALHVQRAFQLHNPKLKPETDLQIPPGLNPWAMLGVKK